MAEVTEVYVVMEEHPTEGDSLMEVFASRDGAEVATARWRYEAYEDKWPVHYSIITCKLLP